jgi:indolepyruvate ferredoxin oxidoreductase alpha subunit
MYELNPEVVREAVFGEKTRVVRVGGGTVPRPPALCPGCPHRGFFYVLSKRKDAVIAGDIGCYTLGCAAPLSAMDTVVCMGGGFSVAMGMAKAFEKSGQTGKKVFGVVGDSTFFHSGMTARSRFSTTPETSSPACWTTPSPA